MLTGLPCCHAMSCMKDQHLDIDDFVPDFYRKECYAACYAPILYPVNGENLWPKSDAVDLQPPPIKRQPGRPKKKRNREAAELVRDETHLRRARNGIKCSHCHQVGHNKATCKVPSTQSQPTQTSSIQSELNATTQEPVVMTTSTQEQVMQTATTQPPRNKRKRLVSHSSQP